MVFTLAYERNKVKYVWINEAGSLFAKEGSLVEVPYVDPLCAICKMICAMCKMLCAICKMIYSMCKMFCTKCSIMSMMMHVILMAWLSLWKIGKHTNFPNNIFATPLIFHSIKMFLGKCYSYSCMSLLYSCIYPYFVQVITNPIQLYNFRCRHR